jgi:hypothetical protein
MINVIFTEHDLLNNPSVDCSEIAEELKKIFNEKGYEGSRLLTFKQKGKSKMNGRINVVEFGNKVQYSYHTVLSYKNFIIDLRFKEEPILESEYRAMLQNINPEIEIEEVWE